MGGFRGTPNGINLGFGIQSSGGGSSTDPQSIEYSSLAEMLADTSQEIGTTGYVPSFSAPEHIRQWDGINWLAVLEYWDGFSEGQTQEDVGITPAIENAVILVGEPYSLTNSVETFASLAGIANPPNDHIVEVTNEVGLTNLFVRWSNSDNVWKVVQCVSDTLPPQTGEWFNQSVGMDLVIVQSIEGASVSCADLLYRWDAGVTVSAGAGGGSIPFWLPHDVYEGNPQVAAWATGKEDVTTDTQLNAQGWSVVGRTRATVATDPGGDRIRFENTTEEGLKSGQIGTLQSGVDSTTRAYSAIRVRGDIQEGSGSHIAFQILGGLYDGTNGVEPAISSHFLSRGAFFWTGSASNIAGSVVDNGLLPDLSSDDVLIEAIYTAGLGLARLYRDGVLIATCTRPASVVSDRLVMGILSGTNATNITKLDLRYARVMTW